MSHQVSSFCVADRLLYSPNSSRRGIPGGEDMDHKHTSTIPAEIQRPVALGCNSWVGPVDQIETMCTRTCGAR
jgi:hypothetical protein